MWIVVLCNGGHEFGGCSLWMRMPATRLVWLKEENGEVMKIRSGSDTIKEFQFQQEVLHFW